MCEEDICSFVDFRINIVYAIEIFVRHWVCLRMRRGNDSVFERVVRRMLFTWTRVSTLCDGEALRYVGRRLLWVAALTSSSRVESRGSNGSRVSIARASGRRGCRRRLRQVEKACVVGPGRRVHSRLLVGRRFVGRYELPRRRRRRRRRTRARWFGWSPYVGRSSTAFETPLTAFPVDFRNSCGAESIGTPRRHLRFPTPSL